MAIFSGFIRSTIILLSLCLMAQNSIAQYGTRSGEWPSYGGDLGSTKYSPLEQVDAANFENLEVAWTWTSVDADLNLEELQAENPDVQIGNFQATPLMVNGSLYIVTALNQIASIDPLTGLTRWTYNPESYLNGPPLNPISYHNRGLAYWTDGSEERILSGTFDGYLISLDANTGQLDPAFNGEGRVDLSVGIPRASRDQLDWTGAQPVGVVSPPIVIGDIVVTSQITQGRPLLRDRPPMWVRGYHIHSGELAWVFHTIPQEGEFGVETWEEESWRRTGNNGVWSIMSADPELGLVYLPLEAPTDDFYGGNRPGDNLFSQSLVAVDAKTGERRWHFQLIHHGIWDYDLPAAPNLIDITVEGKDVKAVAQVTKQGFVYTFERETGEPIWAIEEREVPPSSMPGEKASPTQPFPTKPPAFEKQGLSHDDLIDFTPELRAEAIEILADYTYGSLFTPPTLSIPGGNRGTILRPSAGGGANWSGAGVDPETGILYIPSADSVTVPIMVETDPTVSTLPYRRISNGGVRGPSGLPILKPPYATITAIDMNKGEILWQVPNGDGAERIENNPALAGIELPPLGGGGRNPLLVTPNLLIHAQNNGSQNKLVARDKTNGAELGMIDLPARSRAAPMTFSLEDKQYIVVSALTTPSPTLIAFALKTNQ